jgi:hypothetical protein
MKWNMENIKYVHVHISLNNLNDLSTVLIMHSQVFFKSRSVLLLIEQLYFDDDLIIRTPHFTLSLCYSVANQKYCIYLNARHSNLR